MTLYVTERLILRNWQDEDLEPFAAINQDPQVMEYFPNTLSLSETKEFIQLIKDRFEKHKFGQYACVLKETKEFIGYVGLSVPTWEAHFTPCVEIGWRLSSKHWGKGYATEAAKRALTIGFEEFGLNEILAFTVPQNQRSRRVMEKIGMTRSELDDFHHPKILQNHPLSLHVLYRIRKAEYKLKYGRSFQ